MPPSELFDALLGPSVGDTELLQAILDVEAALARAAAEAGVLPSDHAEAIAAVCEARRFDMAELARATRLAGNPAIAVVAALTALAPAGARGSVHIGGTSQDIVDNALQLIVQRRRVRIDAHLDHVGTATVTLAERHRSTLMAGRTLMQHALPITFGLKAAQWLAGVTDSRRRLRQHVLTVQFGGAAGTLASLGSTAVAATMRRSLAAHLGLADAPLPWPTARAQVASLGSTLAIACGSLAKMALDVELLMQTEVAELFERAAIGKGVSSTLPHKRNPVSAVSIRAAHQQAVGLASTLLFAMVQEHERAAGAWQGEWEPLMGLLRLAEGAAAQAADMVEGLEIDIERMRTNLDLTGGRVLAEAIVTALRPALGRDGADAVVRAAAAQPGPLRANLPATPEVAALGDTPFDPAHYLGSTDSFIDYALADWRSL